MKEGQRVRLRRDVERYPHFVAPAGAVGTITHGDPGTVHVRLDEMLEGAEDWDNEVIWELEGVVHILDDLELLPDFATPRDLALAIVSDLLLRPQIEMVGIVEDDNNDNEWRAKGTQAVSFQMQQNDRTFLVTVEDITDDSPSD